MTVETTAEGIVASFDKSDKDYSCHDVSTALRRLIQQLRESSTEIPTVLRAECVAFDFMENYPEDKNTWGTYHGPMAVLQNAQGQWVEIPSLSAVTGDDLEYWSSRAREVSHPLLKIRYADLVWDFSRKVTGRGAFIEMARMVVDATVALAAAGTHEAVYTKEKLGRALSVALSVRDAVRIKMVRDTIIAYEEKVAQDSLRGLWGFSFDFLVDDAHVPLAEGQEAAIIRNLEERMGRLMGPPPDPHGVEAAALRLVGYYSRKNQTVERDRVLALYTAAYSEAANAADPLVATMWLQEVYQRLRNYGLAAEASAIAKQLRELGPRAAENMKTVSWTHTIPAEKMDAYLDELTGGELSEALARITWQFVPKRDAVEAQVKDLADKAPLQFLVRKVIFDHERPVATIGSLEEDLEGHVTSQIAQNIQIESVFVGAALDRLRSDGKLTNAGLGAEIAKSPAFAPDGRQLTAAGISRYLADDYVSCCSILVPQIEAGVRNLLGLSGGNVYRQGRNGVTALRQLDDILRDPVLIEILGLDVCQYFRAVLTDQRGLNLRNAICHGFAPAGLFSRQVADRLLHLIIVLSQLREAPAEEAAGS